ncbi:MAG: CAP domain-containing protein [Armatimonadota bacterium]|nr:CAP domain-containing protein [Armatimonadota bacterium]
MFLALSVMGGVALGVWLSLPAEVVAGKGESWAVLARRHGVSVRALRAANPGLAAPKPGEPVRLPIPRWRFYVRSWGVEEAVAEILVTPTPARPARRASLTPTPSGPVERRDLAEAIFAKINAWRQAEGLPPLAWDEELYQAALARARDMWARRYIAHRDPETGASLVPCPCGEVIATTLVATGGAFDPAAQWKASPPHRAILTRPFHRGAVAVLQGPPARFRHPDGEIVQSHLAVGLVR